MVAGADQAVEAGFVKAERREKFGGFLFRQLGDFGFDGSRDDDAFGALFGGHLGDASVCLLPVAASPSATLQT